mmetsp:Transcript_16068/g.33620  ORF Transcript_16068/g.33620 Transcript_16068/m.33620 type:complete len:147 (-) Transcript_16068:330-770(-)
MLHRRAESEGDGAVAVRQVGEGDGGESGGVEGKDAEGQRDEGRRRRCRRGIVRVLDGGSSLDRRHLSAGGSLVGSGWEDATEGGLQIHLLRGAEFSAEYVERRHRDQVDGWADSTDGGICGDLRNRFGEGEGGGGYLVWICQGGVE